MSVPTSVRLRLRCVEPSGDVGDALRLCDAVAGALRSAHLLAEGTGSWGPTPGSSGPAVPLGEGSDRTLLLKPGVTVRQRFSDASRYEPGQELQHYTFTAVGWPGARLVVTGNTAAVEAEGQLEADTPRAALALWKALLPPLREAGWRDLTLADAELAPGLLAAASAGEVPLPLKHLYERLHHELTTYLLRWTWKDGTLDLPALLSWPLTAAALDAVLRALPEGQPRDLRLPYGRRCPLPSEPGRLSDLVRLEGAFDQLPPPGLLAKLESLWFSVHLPGGSWHYPWDELPALRRVDLHAVELDALPPALYLSPTLRELSVSGRTLQLEPTAAAGPLRLERLQLADARDSHLPSTATLQHLSLSGCELPGGAFPRLPALRSLTLSRCRWTSLPPGLEHATRLEELSVEDCPLSTLEGLPPLPALRRLSLRATRLDTFPEALERLPALTYVETWHAGPGMGEAALRARLPRLEHLHVVGD